MKKTKRLSILFLVVYLVTCFVSITQVNAADYHCGDVIDSVQVVGALQNEGDVELTKKVELVDAATGVYRVTMTVKGKEYVTTTTNQLPLYSVVVFDRSGSMGSSTKWTSAVEGAKTFADVVLSKVASANIALVTFDSNSTLARDFASAGFTDNMFGSATGTTNLTSGINMATDKLNSVSGNIKKSIVIISDGSPDSIASSTAAANNAKSQGIEIYTIGYNVTVTTRNFLKSIATAESYYVEADPNSIGQAFSDIATQTTKDPAATDAIIKDTIGDDFEYLSSTSSNITINGKEITYPVASITGEGSSFSFDIKLKDGATAGIYETNNTKDNGVNVTYKNAEMQEKILSIEKSSKIYHDPNEKVVPSVVTPPKTSINNNSTLFIITIGTLLVGTIVLKKKINS